MFERFMDWTEIVKNNVAGWLQEDKTRDQGNGMGAFYAKTMMQHAFASVLPYEAFDSETSLFINKNSMGFILETTPLLGSNEQTETILTAVITDILPEKVDMQFHLWGSSKIAPMLDEFANARSKHEQCAWLAQKRVDYLAKAAHGSLGDDSSLLRNIRTFLVCSAMKKHTDIAELIGLRDDIRSSLLSIHIGSRVIDANQFLSTFADIITPTADLYPHSTYWNECDTLSQQLTHPECMVNVHPDKLTFSLPDHETEVHCLTVREFPLKPAQYKTADNLGQLFNSTLQIPCPFLMSFSLRKLKKTMNPGEELSSMHQESTAHSPLARFKPTLQQEIADQKHVQARLAEGDCLVKTHYQILLFTPPNKAKFCERRVRDLHQANGWKLHKERFLTLQSWLAALPMTMSEGLFDDFTHFGRLRTMTAFNAVNVAPIHGDWKGSATASLLLPSRRGQIALWNPFDNEGNFNIVIVAAPRKGKSAFTNDYIISILGGGGRVWVIDVGGSYKKTCQQWGGEFLEFSETTHICLNPFTRITNIDESMELLKPLIASMARHMTGASEEEITFIEKAIKAAWESYGNQATITTVADWLSANEHPVANNLAHLLFSYTKDGSFARFFDGECTIDFSNPFIVLELQALDRKKDLQRIIMQMLIFLISQAMYHSDRSQIKTCIIDEAWKQLNSDDRSQAAFIEAGYRTAPKHRGNFISIAHAVSDFHGNRMSKVAFDCSDFKIILGQTEEAINKLKASNIMDIDGFRERVLKSLRITKQYSECVLISPDGWSVHRIIFDPYSRILYSTKGQEFEAVEQLTKSGMTLSDAIETVIKEFKHV